MRRGDVRLGGYGRMGQSGSRLLLPCGALRGEREGVGEALFAQILCGMVNLVF